MSVTLTSALEITPEDLANIFLKMDVGDRLEFFVELTKQFNSLPEADQEVQLASLAKALRYGETSDDSFLDRLFQALFDESNADPAACDCGEDHGEEDFFAPPKGGKGSTELN